MRIARYWMRMRTAAASSATVFANWFCDLRLQRRRHRRLVDDVHGDVDGGIDIIHLCSAPSPQEVDDMTLSRRDFFLLVELWYGPVTWKKIRDSGGRDCSDNRCRVVVCSGRDDINDRAVTRYITIKSAIFQLIKSAIILRPCCSSDTRKPKRS